MKKQLNDGLTEKMRLARRRDKVAMNNYCANVCEERKVLAGQSRSPNCTRCPIGIALVGDPFHKGAEG